MQKLVPTDAVLVPETASKAFTGTMFDVYQWNQELYDGSHATFEMLRRPDTTSVMCVVDGKLIVLDEEQPGRGKRRSFPGGRIDPEDESTLAGAQREVLEEVGYQFDNWRLVLVQQPIKKMEWFVYYYVAWGVRGQAEVKHDPGEKIAMELLDFAQVLQLAKERAGFLHEASQVFEDLSSIEQLLELPEFTGTTVDR